MFFYNIAAEIRNRPFGHNRTFRHNIETVGNRKRKIEILFYQEDADFAFAFDFEDGCANLIDDRRLNPFGGFIEDEQLWFGEQCPGDCQLLLLAAAQDAAFALQHGFEDGNNSNIRSSSLPALRR